MTLRTSNWVLTCVGHLMPFQNIILCKQLFTFFRQANGFPLCFFKLPLFVNALSHVVQANGSLTCGSFHVHQCEFSDDTILFELLVTFFARMRLLPSNFINWKRLPKLLVTFCARMTFSPQSWVCSYKKFILYPNCLTHALHGWGFSPVWVC